jgi:ElaB/YqjD/DUF883 family membrane-anchored ribosome-binding protein
MTHLFDAVRFADNAHDLEESARSIEGELEEALSKLEAQTEEVSNLLTSMNEDKEAILKELSQQVDGFLKTAREQAKSKLQKRAKQRLDDLRRAISSEKDKALKSLEAYFASDPLPVIENVIQVRLAEGIYEARSRYECEGGIKYDFRLAAQNSKIFHEPFTLSQLGHELRVPVRFSRALLSKTRTPGYERLDQYLLSDAEASGEKLRANFEKPGNGARLKVVTSGSQEDGFVSLEYSDQVQAVSVMNDPSLVAFVDVEAIKRASGEIVAELGDLSRKKVALLRLTINGEQSLNDVSCREILHRVMGVMGPAYRESIKRMTSGGPANAGDDIDLDYIKDRLKIIGGDLSKSVSQTLGITGA